jgi:L-lactate dehydrogenase complex protein LldE
MRIALFITCFNDTFFPEAGQATVKLLERLGHTVEFPEEQTCCGQMHFNAGYRKAMVPLARRCLEIFEPYDAVVSPSASCVGMVREFYKDVADQEHQPELARSVDNVAPRFFELTEFLVNKLGVEDVGAYYPHRVTYHSSCHSLRVLRLEEAPLRLLNNVRGLQLVDLPDADECCGFGGTFSIKNPDVSMAMVGDKVRHIVGTGAEIVTSCDNSCLMNIGGSLHRARAGVRTVHIAEILASTETG